MKNVLDTVLYYKEMELKFGDSSMLREVKHQYADMSAGGGGGMAYHIGEPIEWDEDGDPIAWKSIRENNYPGYPDEFFQEVRDLLGWL